MAEVPAKPAAMVPIAVPAHAVASELSVDPSALAAFNSERIRLLQPLFEHAEGNAYYIVTARVVGPSSSSVPATLLAPVSAAHCAAGAAAARDVSDELGWGARWDVLDGTIVARYEEAQGDLVAKTAFDFYSKVAARLGPSLLQALTFDIDSGAE